MRIGVILPSVATQRDQQLDIATAARHAEQAGLAGVWHGDHLATGAPSLDCTVALAAAAAATHRIHLGTSVYVAALRPLAWAAKQIASLQHISGGRVLLGIGSGGHPAQWAAAGIPYVQRGIRTDTALRLLPELLAGRRVTVPEPAGPAEVQLSPAVPVPPMWVGNHSAVARRRAALMADGWFPSLITPAELAAGLAELTDLATRGRRPVPAVAVGATGVLGTDAELPTRDEIAAGISHAYRRSVEDTMRVPITGPLEGATERLAAYRDAGADHLVFGIAGGDWRHQCDLLAQAASALR
ncbi:LLM class flavin-dependent oxidoreductase [Nocardia amamiensis]|uniref:LLM class flavin-dependent oxidoreductase n=1 Tax=Nocardia amamiensis TaxID=404578 RepID=UPI0008297EFE|nr:LLM class flavin-dependent oxidoreductase [Nocardia amamiensis]